MTSLVLCGTALAQDAANATKPSGVIRFVHDASLSSPLLEFAGGVRSSEAIGGLIADLNRAIARELGLKPEHLLVPRRRLDQVLADGSADVLCYANQAWMEKNQTLRWSQPYLRNASILVALPETPLPERASDVNQGRIGTVAGYVYPELQAVLSRPGVVRDDAPGDEANFRKLLLKRTQYLVTNSIFLDNRVRLEPALQNSFQRRVLITSFETTCVLSAGFGVSLEAFNGALARLRKSGSFDVIEAGYR